MVDDINKLDPKVKAELLAIREMLNDAEQKPDVVQIIDRILESHYLNDYAAGKAWGLPGRVKKVVDTLTKLKEAMVQGDSTTTLGYIRTLLESDRFNNPVLREYSGEHSVNEQNTRENMRDWFKGVFQPERFAQDMAELIALREALLELKPRLEQQAATATPSGPARG